MAVNIASPPIEVLGGAAVHGGIDPERTRSVFGSAAGEENEVVVTCIAIVGTPSQPANPDSANLFASYSQQGTLPGLVGRRESTSSDFPFQTDSSGPPTSETILSTTSEEQHPVRAVPNPRVQQPRQSGALNGGGFKCDYEGCKAPAFQTQYLLKYTILFPVSGVY